MKKFGFRKKYVMQISSRDSRICSLKPNFIIDYIYFWPKTPFKLINLKDFSWYVPVLCKLKNIFDLSFLYENEQIKSTIKIGLDFYLCPIKS